MRPPALFAFAAVASLIATAVVRADVPPGWSPELTSAFAAYDGGQFEEALRLARLSVDDPSDRVSLDAELLAAMATIRGDSREDWTEGRGRLTRLIEFAPRLAARPEVRLALGLGHLALNETSSALANLAAAEQGFAAQQRPAGRLEALAGLAEAWAIHNEWATTPALFGEATPSGADAASDVRARHIRALRATAAALAGSDAAVARIDLALGTLLFQGGRHAAEGREILEAVSAKTPVDATVARAALLLADDLRDSDRADEAAQLYGRVAGAKLGELSIAAERALRAIRAPGFAIDVPRRAESARPVGLDIKPRNIAAGGIEVRRVDFAAWMTERRGMYSEAALPEEGAVAATAQFAPAEPGRKAAARTHSECALAAGTYVVIARGRDAAGKEVVAKRLLVVDGLNANVIVGGARGLVLLGGAGAAEARFWMNGTYAPMRIAIADGVGVFTLPPEAGLLRDRRWTCVVTRGDRSGVCTGELPSELDKAAVAQGVLLSLSPAAPRVGEEVVAMGVAGPGASESRRGAAPAVDISLVDGTQRALARVTAPVDPRGVFTAHVRVTQPMAGKTLQALVHQSGQVIEQLYRRASVSVAPLDEPTVRAEIELRSYLAQTVSDLPVMLRTEWAGGAPLGGERFELATRSARWPYDSLPQFAPLVVSDRESMPSEGRRQLAVNIEALGLPEGPKSVDLRLTAFCPDARVAVGAAPLLIGPDSVHGWIEVDAERPTVGAPTFLTVGWFDSLHEIDARPRLEIEEPGGDRLPLPLYECPAGLRSAEWIPSRPGRYTAYLMLGTVGGAAKVTKRGIDVLARSDDGPAETVVRLTKNMPDELRFSVRGAPGAEVFMLVLGSAPECAVRVQAPPGGATQEGVVQIDSRQADSPRRAIAFRLEDGTPVLLGAWDVAEAAPLALTLKESDTSIFPGGVKNFTASLADRPLAGATLIARLVDARSGGRFLWIPSEVATGRIGAVSRVTSQAASHAGGSADRAQPVELRPAEPADAATVALLGDESSLWGDAQRPMTAEASVGPAIPARQGLYRLEVLARFDDGAIARGARLIDTRRSAEVELDFPATMEPGDRVSGLVRIVHRAAVRTSAILRFKLPKQMRVRRLADAGGREVAIDGDTAALLLEPQATTKLHVELEALAPGRVMLRAELDSADERVSAAAPLWIAAAEPQASSSAAAGIRVRRTLYRLQRPFEWATLVNDPQQGQREVDLLPRYNRIPIADGESIEPGTLVLVEESVELPARSGEVEWEQRVPANCVSFDDAPKDFNTIGRLESRRTALLRYLVAAGGPATRVHDYVIVATRIGACTFSPPAARSDHRALPLDIETTPAKVNVAGRAVGPGQGDDAR